MRRYAIQVAWPEQAETTVSKASQADNPIGQAAYPFTVLWQLLLFFLLSSALFFLKLAHTRDFAGGSLFWLKGRHDLRGERHQSGDRRACRPAPRALVEQRLQRVQEYADIVLGLVKRGHRFVNS